MLRYALTALVFFGALQAVAGLLAVRWFVSRPKPGPHGLPAVTVLKPICGDEVLLEQAITSFCTQDYPKFQLVIGAQDPNDPALAVARRVQARFPALDISIVVDGSWHGCNRKIANLMNMLPLARHDILVMADSDLHVRPDYLRQIVAALQVPGTGLVTTACVAEPSAPGLAPLLGMGHISHIFLPGALMAAALGRQDCLGGTMALRRCTLAQIGGLAALVNHLADDNVLGTLVRRLGLSVRIAPTMPVMVVQERRVRDLWQHELRWARTIRRLAPVAFTASTLQFPLFWGIVAIALSGGASWAIIGFLAAWGVRAAVICGIDMVLRGDRARPAPAAPLWLLPLRDMMSVAVLAASFLSDKVVWRGHVLRAGRGPSAQSVGGSLGVPMGVPLGRALPLPDAVSFEDESLRA